VHYLKTQLLNRAVGRRLLLAHPGPADNVTRANRPNRLPVALTQAEVRSVLGSPRRPTNFGSDFVDGPFFAFQRIGLRNLGPRPLCCSGIHRGAA